MEKGRWDAVGTCGIGRRTVGDLRLCEPARVVASRQLDRTEIEL